MMTTISSLLLVSRALFTNYIIFNTNITIPHVSLFWSVFIDHLFDGYIMYLSKKIKTIDKVDGNLLIFKIILISHVFLYSLENCQLFIVGSLLSCIGSFTFLLEKEYGIEHNSFNNYKNYNKCYKIDIKYNHECLVCLEQLEKELCKLPCEHVFHINCMKSYVSISNNNICPVCRGKF